MDVTEKPKYSQDYSKSEMMAVIVANQISNEDVAFIGVGIPLIAATLAANTHAPEAILVYEAGGIGAQSNRIPWTVSDTPCTDNALSAGPMHRVFSDCQRGFITLGVIGGAEIDKYGNINTSVILGDGYTYDHPRVRLPGSGGANDIASSSQRTLIVMRLQKGKFVEKVSYITSPGFIDGAGAREKAGLVGGGPYLVVTDLCTFRFNADKEMYLDALFPGVTVEQVKELVGWELKVADNLALLDPPTEEQVQMMRSFDPSGTVLGSRSLRGDIMEFEEYYQLMKTAYTNKRKASE